MHSVWRHLVRCCRVERRSQTLRGKNLIEYTRQKYMQSIVWKENLKEGLSGNNINKSYSAPLLQRWRSKKDIIKIHPNSILLMIGDSITDCGASALPPKSFATPSVMAMSNSSITSLEPLTHSSTSASSTGVSPATLYVI